MLVTREFAFDAVHFLPSYRGSPEAPHGHRWRIEVTVEAPVGPEGMAFDFAELGEVVRRRVVERFEGRSMNEVVPVPSAENVALFAWKALRHLPLRQVRVWESEGCSAICREEDVKGGRS
ncbi:MAG: 6-carboxytetrahydropterin synthase [Planctomycetes bacterium]|jgi:6-pyruvoyltetrahydropterin/6-carboxytetrahydropterin synthase|nr:6-carboxytetrahydropterin synthase [Planctomycetota bacterium]